jgi:nicotinamide mononucleotide transporter
MSIVTDWFLANYIEVIAAVLGLVGVWLTAKQYIWCWPVGLVCVILSAYVFFTARLYADVVLQCFYFVMTLYGWYYWIFGGKKKYEVPVRRIRRTELIIILLIGMVSNAIMGYIFARYTNAAYPYWDSFVTVWGIIGTWAMAKKIIEHWIMWIIIDLNCTAIYFFKELYAFTPQYFVFTLLAVYGYMEWKKELKKYRLSAA